MLNEITDYIVRDSKTFSYVMDKDFGTSTVFAKFKKFVNEQNIIVLPYVTEAVTNIFPFIQNGIKKDIIDNSIEQGNCVHDMVSRSIKARNQEKITLEKNECKNPNHIALVIKIISVLNSFIYKHKIKKIYSESSFISFAQYPVIGTPDILMTNGREWFLMDVKTSRINFVEKAEAQLFLYKEIIESAHEIKITESFIINPREEKTVHTVAEPPREIRSKLLSYIADYNK